MTEISPDHADLRSGGVDSRRPWSDDGYVTESEIIEYVSSLPGVVWMTASEENGAPAVAWGDTFFFYDPEGNVAEDRRTPFATMVTHNYPGWDTESDLDRHGIFRLNIAVGRSEFQRLIGYPPADQDASHQQFDYAAIDVLLPHPLYASQGWISILNPGAQQIPELKRLLDHAYHLAVGRHARRRTAR
jgi:Family of unknown function (DUF6194)